MRGRTAIVVAAGALVAAGAPAVAPAQEPGPAPAQLATTAGFGGRGDVLLVDADGTRRQRPLGVRDVGQPAWAPNGRALALVVFRGAAGSDRGTSQIDVVDAAGGDRRRLTGGRRDAQPAWSPDGRRLAFGATTLLRRSVRASIMVVNADGSGRTRLTVGHWDSDPAWSPDGESIAFSRVEATRRGGPRVWIMNADGSGARPLARGWSPSWSPDGTRIAFASDRDRHGQTCYHDCTPNHEIYAMRADGSGQTRLTRDPGDDVLPRWSPDGGRIAFTSDRNYPPSNQSEVYTMDPDGRCVTRITNSSSDTDGSAWRPGRAPPARGPCGGDAPGAVAPVVEVDLTRAARGSLFAGPSFRGMLLSHLDGRLAVYDDCAFRVPRRCLGQVQLQTWSICRRQPLSYGGAPDALGSAPFVPRYSWRRGALLAGYGADAHTDVHTGPWTVAVFGPGRRDVAAAVVDALRPVHDPQTPRLAPPAFGARALRLVREVQVAYRRLRTVPRVQRALGLTRERVVQRLALGRALRGRALGRSTRC